MAQHIQVDSELNLKGEVCPYTFVKTKLALEEMGAGEVLRVIVDNDESGENVPRSLRHEGHDVLGAEKVTPTDWEIVVRKA